MSNATVTVQNNAIMAAKADIHVGGTSYRLPRAPLARVTKAEAPKAG